MIRTVWLAIVCLVLVSALAAGKALRMPADSTVAELSADETTVGIDQAEDALGKADRLEINYVRREIPPQPVITVNRASRTSRHPAQADDRNQDHKPALARSKCLFIIA